MAHQTTIVYEEIRFGREETVWYNFAVILYVKKAEDCDIHA